MPPVVVEVTVVPAMRSVYFCCGSPGVAIPMITSSSQNSQWILLTFLMRALSNVSVFPSVVVALRFMNCLPKVEPLDDSMKEA